MSTLPTSSLRSRQSATGPISAVNRHLNGCPEFAIGEDGLSVRFWVSLHREVGAFSHTKPWQSSFGNPLSRATERSREADEKRNRFRRLGGCVSWRKLFAPPLAGSRERCTRRSDEPSGHSSVRVEESRHQYSTVGEDQIVDVVSHSAFPFVSDRPQLAHGFEHRL